LAIDKAGVDITIVAKELAIDKGQAHNESKPAAMLDKIAQGRLSKFFQRKALPSPAFCQKQGGGHCPIPNQCGP